MSSMTKQTQQRTSVLAGHAGHAHSCGHFSTVLRTGTRSANTFSEPQTTFCRCSTGRSIRHCIGWSGEDGSVSKWETAPDRNREFKYYRLTEKGRKQLVVEESQWKQMAEAVARVMWPAAEES